MTALRLTALKPIRVSGRDYATVADAILAAMRLHESIAASPGYDVTKYPSAAKDLLRHLWNDLAEIRDGIAARAPSTAEEEIPA